MKILTPITFLSLRMSVSLKNITSGFILKRPMKLESFRAVGVGKIVSERGWGSTILNISRFVTKIVHKFYANLGRTNLKKCL